MQDALYPNLRPWRVISNESRLLFIISKIEFVEQGIKQDLYIFNQFLLTKNQEWSYENEVRLFTTKGDKVNYYSYQYPDCDKSKINARICSITLGYKFPTHKKDLISNLIKTLNNQRKPHEPKITLKQAHIDEFNNFSLVYKDLDLL